MVGIKINAINIEADKIIINVKGRNFMNSPVTPGQNNKGKKAESVVMVEAIIGQDILSEASI
jgi:hypothetical protein